MNDLSLQGPHKGHGDSSIMQRRSVGTLDSQQFYREVTTLTITALNLEFSDFVVFWPFLVTNDYL